MTISPEVEAQILRYYHVEKWRVGTIARHLRLHCDTVARVVAQAGVPLLGRAARSQVDPYLPFIHQTLEKFPTLTFKSTSVKKAGKDKLAVTGDLTMHGVTRPVTLDVQLTQEIKSPFGDVRRGATASGKINRKDFGLNWNKLIEAGGVVVGEEVALTIDVELVKQNLGGKPASR